MHVFVQGHNPSQSIQETTDSACLQEELGTEGQEYDRPFVLNHFCILTHGKSDAYKHLILKNGLIIYLTDYNGDFLSFVHSFQSSRSLLNILQGSNRQDSKGDTIYQEVVVRGQSRGKVRDYGILPLWQSQGP